MKYITPKERKEEKSIQKPFTSGGATETWYPFIAVEFALELIIVCQLLILFDIPHRIDDNTLATLDLYDLRRTIRSAAVIYEPGNSALLCGIDHSILVDTEKVTASNTALDIFPFSHVGNLLADNLSDILDDHVVGRNVFHSIQAPVVNC